MKRRILPTIISVLLLSGYAYAQSNVNVSKLYGWNGTHKEVIE
jgi:hypothetical protein